MEQFVIGFIRGSHGVTGNFKVESASGEYEHFASLTEVTLRNGQTGVSKLYAVENVEICPTTLFMKLAGINSPEDVRKVNGWEIVVPRDKACPLDKNEWYVEDLKQCALVYKQGKDGFVVGTVTDVLEGGTGNLLEVALAENSGVLSDDVVHTADGKVRTVLVPFINEFIGKVDIKHRTLELMHLWILE
ncbi:MAG: ribosome maturation factor RimM [Treponema sp.]|nr:ribosome maturation factor RimM [Treponema sp.]